MPLAYPHKKAGSVEDRRKPISKYRGRLQRTKASNRHVERAQRTSRSRAELPRASADGRRCPAARVRLRKTAKEGPPAIPGLAQKENWSGCAVPVAAGSGGT